MKTTLLAAMMALSLTASAVHAESEGAGDPLVLRAPGITVVSPQAYADLGSAAYPDLRDRPFRVVILGGPDVMLAAGSEGIVQTANSLPRGFAEGAAAFAQNRPAQRSLAEQAARPIQAPRTALVQKSRPPG